MELIAALQQAVRRLRRAPAFTLFSCFALVVAIAASSSVYGFVAAALWRPMGISHLASLAVLSDAGRDRDAFSLSDFFALTKRQTDFSALAAVRSRDLALESGGNVQTARIEVVSGDYFGVLGVPATIGRTLTLADSSAGAPAVVALSEEMWARTANRDPGIVGTTIHLAGEPFEVVGVVRAPFGGLSASSTAVAWIPESDGPTAGQIRRALDADKGATRVSVIGRLKSGQAAAAALANVRSIGNWLETNQPRRPHPPRTWSFTVGQIARDDPARSTLGMLTIVTGYLVLAVTCACVGNLTLARALRRKTEFSIQLALGARAAHLVRDQLLESTAVAVVGGGFGILIADLAFKYARTAAGLTNGPFSLQGASLDPRVIAVASGSVIAAILVSGLWPAIVVIRNATSFRKPITVRGGQTRVWRTHHRVIRWQVAVSYALCLVAAVCLRAISAAAAHSSGVDMEHIAVAQVDFASNGRGEMRARDDVKKILTALGQSGAQDSAASVGLPFGVGFFTGWLSPEERPFLAARDVGQPTYVVGATPSLFHTLGVAIRDGRGLSWQDVDAHAAVVVVSSALAKACFGTEQVVGQRVWFGESPRASDRYPPEVLTIVGVAADTDTFQLTSRGNLLYLPFFRRFEPVVTFTARSESSETALVGLLHAIRAADPTLAVGRSGTGFVTLGGIFPLLRAFTVVALALSIAALAISTIGLFGILSQATAWRIPEIAVRVALGASPRQVVGLIGRMSLQPVAEGCLLGLAIGSLGRLAVQPYFSERVTLIDPIAVSTVPFVLLGAAVLATLAPARAASLVAPNALMRTD